MLTDDQLARIVAVLRAVAYSDPYGDTTEPEGFCIFCGGYRGYDQAHTAECAYLVAGALEPMVARYRTVRRLVAEGMTEGEAQRVAHEGGSGG